MICPNCQTANPDLARFCMNCGIALIEATQANEGSRSGFDLYRYIPRELMNKLNSANSQGGMKGERRIITILFCDVKGSTAAAEKLDPEEWTKIINGAFERMIQPIYKYEGFVPRLMGDAILAFFGAPIANEDDPQRAVLAALDIQSGIEPYGRHIEAKYGIDFKVRIGINTGLVVVGEIGSDLRLEYTAVGDAINIAARMEQTARPGTIQITEDTYKLISPLFDFESLGGIEVKGKSAPIQTYRVLNAKATPGPLRGLEGLSSPLVGREDQLAFLKERLRQLSQGTGAFILIVGEAGLGKSSLISESQKWDYGSGIEWLRGEALSYSRSISYFPWRQIIRQAIDVHTDDLPAVVRGKLNSKYNDCSLPDGDIPFIEAILSVESDESVKVLKDYQGEILVGRITQAVRGFLCGLMGKNPVTLVLDDLHWADEASLNLLLNLGSLSTSQSLLFICMLRPDQDAASWKVIQTIREKIGGHFHSIMLEPLPVEQTDALLNNLLGMKDFPKKVRDLIVEKAGGNPFFVEELIRSLVETKQIMRQDSHWRVSSQETTISLPNNLRGVLSARIDRLPDRTRHILQLASVIGRSFDVGVLGRLTKAEDVASHVEYLMKAGLVETSQSDYAFRHVLIQDAAYDSILLKERLDLHRQVGETLEELHVDRIEEYAQVLAHHFYAAQDARSLKYDLLAGERAARMYANAEAATYFARALETAKGAYRGDKEQIAQIYAQLGNVLELSGRHPDALKMYDEMLAFARERNEKSMELNALMAEATIYSIFSQSHNSALSEARLTQALAVSNEIGERPVQARLNWNLMLNYLFSKRLDQAHQHGELALALARESNDREQLAFILNDLCRLYTCRGEFENALAVVREARELWLTLDNQPMFIDGLGAEAEALFNAGNYDQSLELSSRALELSQKIENLWGQAYNRMLMGFVLSDRGEIGRTIQLWDEAVALGDKGSLLASTIGTRSDLAWLYGYYGAVDKGLDLVRDALEAAEAKQPDWKDLPLAVRVRLHLLNGDRHSAETIGGRLEPISIPYARYTILVRLAEIELAAAQGNNEAALSLVDNLLNEVVPLTRPDIPEVMRTKGDILVALGRFTEARQVLMEARAAAESLGSKHNLWMILASFATVDSKLGKAKEAASNRSAAMKLVMEISESLIPVGLNDSFLSQPRVRGLMRA